MDLGLKGRKAIVCASSKGLGKGCAMALAEAGCDVVVNGRDEASLAATAKEIAGATGATVIPVVADVGTEAGRETLLAACPSPDILVNNNGGPPPKPPMDLTEADILAGLYANMLTPIALIQAVMPAMKERRFGRIVNITSAAVKMSLPGLAASSGARAGLTAFLSGMTAEVAPFNVTINYILPGIFDTDRVRKTGELQAKQRGITVDEVIAGRLKDVPAGRLGTPKEFGRLCAFLASADAGYITGQNMLIDGGWVGSNF